MTTIAYRDGVMAADSRTTTDSEAGGTRSFKCLKIVRKRVTVDGEEQEAILAGAGESFPSDLYVSWFGSGKEPHDMRELFLLGEADFSVLILLKSGLYEVDKYCHLQKVLDRFYAIGSGAKAALGAMHMGAGAEKAVRIACKVDPFSAPPVVTMTLRKPAIQAKAPKRRRPATSSEALPSPQPASKPIPPFDTP